MRRALFVALTLAAAACSVFTDFGGLSGGEGAPIDGAAESDPSTIDAGGNDAREDDATDGGNDAALDGGFCADALVDFCSDFDTQELNAEWTELKADNGATIGFGTTRTVSAPRSLHATMPRREDVNATYYAYAAKTFVGPWRRTLIQFDVFVETMQWLGGDINAGIFNVGLVSSSSTKYFSLALGQTATTLGVTDYPSGITGPAFPTNQWVRVNIALDPDKSILVNYDGVSVERTFSQPFVSGTIPRTRLELGVISFNDPVPAFDVSFDNVRVQFVP